jgi:hypothetical protein
MSHQRQVNIQIIALKMFFLNNLLLRQECFEREASQNAALWAVEKFIAKEAKNPGKNCF